MSNHSSWDEIDLSPMFDHAPPSRPWPHFPHCPECRRRLWVKEGSRHPITPPTADMRCPHCNADLQRPRP
ncbi:DNA-directed RNA polymerase subunit RPC12/RpoP [Rhodococcus sp. PvP104]|nr:DNA-directed RNA polymerase subunit RPC12/RpoP [Rhodococcus sp. PvP104]